jgi:Ras GTPase-activating-like protein IQGAP2/3
MIIEKQPSQNPRRTLTLVAKMLQNLANKPSHSKEAYMSSLQSFIDENKSRIAKFLNEDLCDVEDFYESLEVSLIF